MTDDDPVQQVARDILDQLQRHPDAADSVEGVAAWWLGPERRPLPRAIVEAALERLVQEGQVEKRRGRGGVVYSRAGRRP